MRYRFGDGAFDYHLRADGRPPDVTGPGTAERVRLSAADARWLFLTQERRQPDAVVGPLRRLLSELSPWVPVSRLSDAQAVDQMANHVATGSVSLWRVRKPLWGAADVGSAVDDAGAPDQAAAGPPATPAQAAPLADPDEPVRCPEAWGAVDRETRAVLAHGGDRDPIERNRHITAAYARYYQRTQADGIDNPWGGIAAIVSGQAGCSMEYADDMRSRRWIPGPAGPAYEGGGAIIKAKLADTNKFIFEDIYPVLRMHEDHGTGVVERCGPARPDPPGPVSDEMKRALRLIDEGGTRNIQFAGDLMAEYEQETIVQDRILNDPVTRRIFRANQQAADTRLGRALGARKPELALTAECPPYSDGTAAIPFRGDFTVTSNRVRYYQDLARSFGRMGTSDRARTLGALARGGL